MKTANQMIVKGNFKIQSSRIHKNANNLFKLQIKSNQTVPFYKCYKMLNVKIH